MVDEYIDDSDEEPDEVEVKMEEDQDEQFNEMGAFQNQASSPGLSVSQMQALFGSNANSLNVSPEFAPNGLPRWSALGVTGLSSNDASQTGRTKHYR